MESSAHTAHCVQYIYIRAVCLSTSMCSSHCDITPLKKRCKQAVSRPSQNGMCIEFKQQVVEFGSGIFCSDASLTRVPQLCQGCHGEAPRLSKDFLGKAKKTLHDYKIKES